MKTLLLQVLESFGYGVYLQGSIPEDATYPDSFITFFTLSGDDVAHYDNDSVGAAWEYQVIFYSSDPALVASVPGEIRQHLKAAGFIPQGRGRDIPSDDPTHTGWAMQFYYMEV